MSAAQETRPAPNLSMVRFLASVSFWVIALFGAFRLPWLQTGVLVRFATLQQGIAVALFGVSSSAVVVDVSCTGSDAMAICFGAILGFPAPWRSRLRAVGRGFALIVGMNIVRIATVSAVVGNRRLFDLLHLYVWPGVMVLVAVLYVFRWMKSVTPDTGPSAPPAGDADEPAGAPADSARGWGIAGSPTARFAAVTTFLVAAYYAASPWLLRSGFLQRGAEWSAGIARTIMSGLGVSAQVNGAVLTAGGSGWVVTPECIVTPLIPVYAAAALCWPASVARRAAALGLGVFVFMFLGVARLLVLAVPASMPVHTVMIHAFYQFLVALLLIALAARRGLDTGDAASDRRWSSAWSYLLRGAAAAAVYALASLLLLRALGPLIQAWVPHLGHGYRDPQGALLILPAFQVGLFVALWSASGGSFRCGRVAAALGLLAMQQVVIAVTLGELFVHAGLEAPIAAVRLVAVAVPAALVWGLQRMPRSSIPAFLTLASDPGGLDR